jgi:hypothetical protein
MKKIKKSVSLHGKHKINKVMATIHGATLNGSVNPNGLDTTVKFLYGTEPTLSTPTELDLPLIPAGHDAVPVSAPVTDLVAETTYYFKVSATNSEGTTEGDILNLITPADVVTGPPIVETLPATDDDWFS